MGDVFQKLRDLLIRVLVWPVGFYQKHISPGLPQRCRYYPTCSEYAVTSLQTHGPLKGVVLGSWRILRCNPWSRGGVDHVPAKGKWKAPEWIPPDDWAGHDIEEGPSGFLSKFRGSSPKKSVLTSRGANPANQEFGSEVDEKES